MSFELRETKGIVQPCIKEGIGCMKSLIKIISRYSITAGVMILVILFSNIAVLGYLGYRSIAEEDDLAYNGNIRVAMEKIGNELSQSKEEKTKKEGKYHLSKKGKKTLKETKFVWAMALNQQGDVVWKWKLPDEIPLNYSLSDVATFTRWYLCDYPVRVWKSGELLCVYAYPKDSYTVMNLYSTVSSIKNFPQYIKLFLIANLTVIIVFILTLGYRFYWSLKPISQGIEALSRKEPIHLRERGIASDLAKKINITSKTLEEQDRKLAKRDQARTEWIAGVSHDIRTPLTLIMGYSERLMSQDESISEKDRKREREIEGNRDVKDEMEGDKKTEKQKREMAKSIYRQAIIIKQLIEDLNLTSKLTYNATPLSLTECEPAKLLRESVADIYNSGLDEKYEIEIYISEEAEQSKVLIDEKLIKRAIRNILGNSIRHNSGGCIVKARLCVQDEEISYTFLDSGPGIPDRVVEILEEERVGNREKIRAQGKWRRKKEEEERVQGIEKERDKREENKKQVHIMGLRLTRQIVEVHGGEFLFCEREEGGYDCRIKLPCF